MVDNKLLPENFGQPEDRLGFYLDELAVPTTPIILNIKLHILYANLSSIKSTHPSQIIRIKPRMVGSVNFFFF